MKTAEELFAKHNSTLDSSMMTFERFKLALTEHNAETIKLIDDIINQHKELNKLFPDESNDSITRAVKIALTQLKNKL